MGKVVRFGSLFSGIGGFDLGFDRSGFECAWQVEIDKDCNRVLERHWPNVKRYQDVSTIGKLESVDVICGGFPCQDLSVAGKRAGLAGERSGLWFEFLRIAGLNRPRFVVIENVPGLLSSDEGRDFAVILRGLVECGYCLAWRIVDAQFYGVAQRRRRVFIVGSLGDGSCAEILFESESLSWNPPTRREAGPGATPILEAGARTNGDGYRDGDGIGVEGDPMFTLQAGKQHGVAATLDQRGRGPTDAVMMNLQIAPGVAPALTSRDGKSTREDIAEPAFVVTHALRSEGADASEDGTGRGTPLVAAPLTANYGKQLDNSDRNGGPPNLIANCFNGYTGGSDDNDAQANHIVSVDLQNTRLGGDVAGSLDTTRPSRGGGQAVIAFSSKDHGADAGEISPTLRSQNFKDSHMNGGGQVAIAFDERNITSRENRSNPKPGDPCHTLHADAPTLAFTERTRSEGRTFEAQQELAYAITNPGSGGRTHSRQVAGRFGVRRLTPRECERLQGFPDDFTRYDASGKEISDSARYRMLGNAICVSVATWLAKRIAEVVSGKT